MFGNFIAQKRKEMGLSLAKLAKLSGHPVSSLHGIENGDNQNPRFEIIIDISQVLGVSLDAIRCCDKCKRISACQCRRGGICSIISEKGFARYDFEIV